MPTIRFVEVSGSVREVQVDAGQSVMDAATGNLVPGIIGECGGCCSCATCHVYVEAPWFERLGEIDEMEAMMLEGAIDPEPNSRLGCQIIVSDELDGLTLRIPAAQM